tara:strand:- start:439 stop:612 length:174 start_codon:yes stop_codon:yes gene_type:complete
MKSNQAQRIAKTIVNGINAAVLPKSSLQMTVKQIRYGWSVTAATAQEIRWILTENWK